MYLSRFREIAEQRRDVQAASVLKAFDATAGDYDRARRQLVPDYDDFYGAAMSCLPFYRHEPLKVLDLGSGTGAFAKMIADAYPHSRIIVSDASDKMLCEARKTLGRDVRYEFQKLDALIDPLPDNVDIIVSSLVIHHFDHADKRAVFRHINQALVPGGVFVNADQVSTGSDKRDAKRFDDWLRDVKAKGVRPCDLKAALKRMKDHDKNAPLESQARWLEEAGFREVEVRYFNYFWAVFCGRK